MPSAPPLPSDLFELIARTAVEGVVIIDKSSRLVFVNRSAATLFGYSPDELMGQPLTMLMPEEFRASHQRGITTYLETGKPRLSWQGIELPGLHRGGRRVPLEISFAEARFGSEIFFAGFLRDLSERYWSQARIGAQFAVSEILSTATEEQHALPQILNTVGEHLGFASGNLWLVKQDCLQWQAGWHAPGTATDEFEQASRARLLRSGEGLPGRVWSTGAPSWISSLQADPNFPRAGPAAASHLRSGLAFPLRAGKQTVGVLEYFSTHERPIEPTLLQILSAIGQQVGQFLERERAREALSSTQTEHQIIFDNANDAFAVSCEECFVYVNQAYATMFGYDHPDELVGVSLYDTIPPAQYAYVREHRQRRQAGLDAPVQYGAWGKRRDGTEFPTEVRATDYSIGGRQYTLAILRDTTRERQAHDVLARSNAALRRANEDLEQFAYAASHDLQEPLRMILIYSQLLQRRHNDELSEEAQKLLATISDGARRINELVKDLLSYTNATGLDVTLSVSTDPNDVLSEVESNLKQQILSTGATISRGHLPYLRVHRTHLLQLLQNLIGNSIKYRSPHRLPRIEVASTLAGAGMSELLIKDNGIGMAAEYHERIFGVFKRLHARSVPGTGIGLAICKKIVQHYGGAIWVDSTLDSGSTFHLTLPLDSSSDSSSAESKNET